MLWNSSSWRIVAVLQALVQGFGTVLDPRGELWRHGDYHRIITRGAYTVTSYGFQEHFLQLSFISGLLPEIHPSRADMELFRKRMEEKLKSTFEVMDFRNNLYLSFNFSVFSEIHLK